ncbi:hypothetical protein HanPSC8_Chr17g0797521 [Helianthus annuus]|nr:hypothetical protein HanPSC8_Chr17g0797521 [Helianthus annuus]
MIVIIKIACLISFYISKYRFVGMISLSVIIELAVTSRRNRVLSSKGSFLA